VGIELEPLCGRERSGGPQAKSRDTRFRLSIGQVAMAFPFGTGNSCVLSGLRISSDSVEL
jgi:hypothetical protein